MRDFRIKVGLSAAFFPHITVGFIGSDIHGVPKSANVIQTNSHHREDIVRLCKCFLHVDVFIVVRPMGPKAILGLGRLLDLRGAFWLYGRRYICSGLGTCSSTLFGGAKVIGVLPANVFFAARANLRALLKIPNRISFERTS
jgi:hypothetical protein